MSKQKSFQALAKPENMEFNAGENETPSEIDFNTVLLKKVGALDLSARISDCLTNSNIIYIGELVQKSGAELLQIQELGKKSLKEINNVLAQMGLYLGMELESQPPENIGSNPALSLKLKDLELSVRSSKCLTNSNIAYVGDLVQYSEAEMLRIPKFGRKSLNEVKKMLSIIGLHLKMQVESQTLEKNRFNPAILLKLKDMELDVRTSNCLKISKIVHVGDLIQYSEAELLRIPNFGQKSLNEVNKMLSLIGLQLGMKVEPWPPANIDFNPALLLKLDNLELSARSSKCLKNSNIVHVGDLVQNSEVELRRIPNFGKKSLKEIKNVLSLIGLHLEMKVETWNPEDFDDLAKLYDLQYS